MVTLPHVASIDTTRAGWSLFCWVVVKVLTLLQASSDTTPASWELPHYCQVGMTVQAPLPMWSPLIQLGEGGYLFVAEMKVPASYLAFVILPAVGLRGLITPLPGWNSRLCT